MNNNVTYDGGLQIKMPSSAPEALHQGLMLAVVNTIRYQMQCDAPIVKEVKESNVHLLDLLKIMLPDEAQLEKTFR